MPDPRFESVHLDGNQRRELFRVARSAMKHNCGEHTLAGDLGFLNGEDPGDGNTATMVAPGQSTFWIQDGDTSHELGMGPNSIGRLSDNNVVIRDECVSRRHCAIVVHSDGTCDLHEMASKNGTLLNGKRISGPTRLRSGDTINLCSRKLIFFARNSRDEAS